MLRGAVLGRPARPARAGVVSGRECSPPGLAVADAAGRRSWSRDIRWSGWAAGWHTPPVPSPRVDLLLRQLDIAWALFSHHVRDLDDATCLWEPDPHCWTVRPDERGRWLPDWQVPEPDPVPAQTIGWITWHLGYWWTTTLEHCFGAGAPERTDITWPGGAVETVAWLDDLHQRWRAELGRLTEEDLEATDRVEGLPWGRGLRLVDIAGWVTVELTKNVAEVGAVRHLCALRSARSTSPPG
ncbi:DinB superfamily protein [Actinoalloteichus cyanogriseus DSM 43889]|uniref:DinB superfamily protein n=1 Tax=Actinoalloteichus caeruleus DSM 43889 TaxID=1120930 RepID=A0ABT1JE50_ACTCY|nr:DinB superfamily protein [Actinoalloteichus caeruleus DSM 43889]